MITHNRSIASTLTGMERRRRMKGYLGLVLEYVKVHMNGTTHEATVSGIVSDVPLDSSNGERIIVCSENMFTALTGITDYKIIEVQVSTDISGQIRNLITPDMKLLDMRQHNEEVRTGYFAMAVFVYGFLIVIALVALINIINTVDASVSGRINYYGVIRAVGMPGKQIQKVIRAEAAAYAVTGSIAGAISRVIPASLFL